MTPPIAEPRPRAFIIRLTDAMQDDIEKVSRDVDMTPEAWVLDLIEQRLVQIGVLL
jgi:hypothetical protein